MVKTNKADEPQTSVLYKNVQMVINSKRNHSTGTYAQRYAQLDIIPMPHGENLTRGFGDDAQTSFALYFFYK